MIREQFGQLYFLREFHKHGQFFIRAHNEPLAVAPMCVSNPDRSSLGINGFCRRVCAPASKRQSTALGQSSQ
jgi:hypothetical protein